VGAAVEWLRTALLSQWLLAVGLVAATALVSKWLRASKRTFSAASATEAKEVTRSTWDFIIVGGGTAGCVLAKRLSEGKSGKRVLVLEAGRGDHDALLLRIPAGVFDTFQTKYDWHFVTEESISEPSAKQAKQPVYIARGKVLGGSSNLNVGLYTRGNASDYDAWVTDCGCEGWTSSEVLRWFKRTEDDRTGAAEKDATHHGRGGEWAVDHSRYQNPLSKCFLKAATEAGFSTNSDFNSWSHGQAGVGRFPVSQDNGTRCSSTSALLVPALAEGSGRLTVLCGAQATRVQLDGKDTKGVEFWAGGQLHSAHLSMGGEVLLAGGAVHSPQLLMLSGIGSAAHLAEHGIQVVSDLAGVGQNLQDHPAVNVAYECPESHRGISPSSKTCWIFGRKIPHPLWILRWLLFKSGGLTSPFCDHGGFFRTSEAQTSSPDLQMRFLPARAVTADGMNSFASFRNRRERLPDGFTFQSVAVRPHSRGHVRLRSADVRDKPIIHGGHLDDPRDVATIREGMRLARTLAKQHAFDDVRGEEVFPGKAVQSDAELDAYIAQTVHTANAVVGTCRMGRPDDPLAVCDAQLRVLGVRGLRICDASVMPLLPGCQTGAPTVMIAERVAELLLGCHD